MLPDNRLDFISHIDADYLDMMTELRKKFMSLDSELRSLGSLPTAITREGATRCLSLARTNIETALQQAIKSLCIMGEVK